MRRSVCLVSLFVGGLILSGCMGSRGIIPIGNVSETQLKDSSFSVVRTNLRGEASCGYILGLLPVGDPAIATRAMDALIDSADLSGKSVGLVNFAGDTVTVNFFYLYQIQTVRMRADAVAFE